MTVTDKGSIIFLQVRLTRVGQTKPRLGDDLFNLTASLTGSKKPKFLKQWRSVITASSSLFLVRWRADLAVSWFESYRKWSNKETTKIKSPRAVVESLANETSLFSCDVRAVTKPVFALVQIESRLVGGQSLQGRVCKEFNSKLLCGYKVSYCDECATVWGMVTLNTQCWRTRFPHNKKLRPALSGRMSSECSSREWHNTCKMKYIAFAIYFRNIIHRSQCEVLVDYSQWTHV